MTETPQGESVSRFILAFWDGLRRTSFTASCPLCGASGLEVRESRGRAGLRWRYVLHCNSAQIIDRPELWNAGN